MLDQIVDGLNEIVERPAFAEAQAKAAMMEWILTLPAGADAQEAARAAIGWCEGVDCPSVALTQFVEYLHDIADTPALYPVRRGGARARRQVH